MQRHGWGGRVGAALSRQAGLDIMSCQSNFKQKELSVYFQIDTLLRGDALKSCFFYRMAFLKEIRPTSNTSASTMMSSNLGLTSSCLSARIFFNVYFYFITTLHTLIWLKERTLYSTKMFLEKQCHVMPVDNMISCNILGQVFIHFPFSPSCQQIPFALHHNEQLPLYVAICTAKDPKYLTLSVFTTILYIYVLEPNVASDRHSSMGCSFCLAEFLATGLTGFISHLVIDSSATSRFKSTQKRWRCEKTVTEEW